MSDTPRTDAEAVVLDPYEKEFVPADFARQLERELHNLAPQVAVTGLSKDEYDALVRDAMRWRARHLL